VTCDFLVRLLATSEEHDVGIVGCDVSEPPPPLSGAGLSLFFQESRGSRRKVTLGIMTLNGDLWHALATMSRLDVEVKIMYCSLVDGAAEAFVECPQSDRGPVELYICDIDNQIIANSLTGSSRVTRFTPNYARTNDGYLVHGPSQQQGSGGFELAKPTH
jgi:hypothetical protein